LVPGRGREARGYWRTGAFFTITPAVQSCLHSFTPSQEEVLRIAFFVLLNLMAGLAFGQNRMQQPSADLTHRVIYGGRLLGYFRWPDQQLISSQDAGCQDTAALLAEAHRTDGGTMSNAARFLRELERLRTSPDTVLVGTGDNFAPELYATTIVTPGGKEAFDLPRVPKDWLTWDFTSDSPSWITNAEVNSRPRLEAELKKGYGWVAQDNVACFLRAAHYDALVPGKFDFYFGPERLRQVARLLASKGDDRFGSVQMLGTNLIISTRDPHANPRVPEWLQNNNFERIPTDLRSEIDRGQTVLPWLRTIRLSRSKDSAGNFIPQQLWICEPAAVGQAGNEAGLRQVLRDSRACVTLTEITNAGGNSEYRMPDDFVLNPGVMYDVVLQIAGERMYVDHFFTAHPFFTYPNPIDVPGAARGVTENTAISPAPYALRPSSDPRREIAIFGIVEQGLKTSIGSLNYSWANERGYTTEVDVIDPMVSLKQVLQYFDADYRVRFGRPFGGKKLLLAQMSHERASEITGVFPGVFSAVIAEGEHEHASQSFETRIKVASTTENTGAMPSGAAIDQETSRTLQWIEPTVVMVPKPFYDSDAQDPAFKLKLQLQAFEFGRLNACSSDDGAYCVETWRYDHERATSTLTNPSIKVLAPNNAFAAALNNVAANLNIGAVAAVPKDPREVEAPVETGPKDVREVESLFEQITLATIRHYPGAASLPLASQSTDVDVSVLQKRDWFDAYVDKIPDNSSPELLQETLDRILWKGDFVHRIAVTGAQLRSAMEQSSVYDRLDVEDLSLSHEKSRGLAVLGLYKDPVFKTYVVNGEPLDDKKLYSVATSDFAALGDTGYPSLREQFWGLPSPENVKTLFHISALVCAQFKAIKEYAGARCRRQVDVSNYFDVSAAAPLDTSPGLTPLKNFLNWATFKVPPNPLQRAPQLERAVQRKGRWNFTVEEASGGYTVNRHNAGTERRLADQLSGIQESGLTDPKTTSWNTRFYAEASRTGHYFRPFLRQELDFQKRLTRLDDESVKPERQRNNIGLEAGVRVPLAVQNVFGTVQLTASLRNDTQLKQPYSLFVLGNDNEGRNRGSLFLQSNQRNGTFVKKLGIRLEGQAKLFEFGFQSGTSHSIPAEYLFNPGTAEQFSCMVPASRLVQNDLGQQVRPKSVADCIRENKTINSQTPYSIRFVNRPAHGLFWNMRLALPLRQERLTYNIDAKGNLYFHTGSDSSIETYYLATLSQSVRVPIAGDLGLVPRLDLIFFENKVERHSLTRIQSSVALTYTFDWRSGLPFRKAASFGLKKK
jgi:hypothetical protein